MTNREGVQRSEVGSTDWMDALEQAWQQEILELQLTGRTFDKGRAWQLQDCLKQLRYGRGSASIKQLSGND